MLMANIGTVFKDEVGRLSRREIRRQLDPTKKATRLYRRQIALLKDQIAQLERKVALVARKVLDGQQAAPAEAAPRPRFVAKGLRSQRKRLGLSATDFGKLVGVSAQSVYNWEHEVTAPRGPQLSRLAALRGIGKREAAARLKAQGGGAAAAGKKANGDARKPRRARSRAS
jgi:DNA-binding transcriptional regulator YiaG